MGFQSNNTAYEGLYILEHSVEAVGHFVCQGMHVSLSGSLLGRAGGGALYVPLGTELYLPRFI